MEVESEIKTEMYAVVGALHAVRKELRAGLNEYCYQEALEVELNLSGVPFRREVTFHPMYRGQELKATFRLDFLCYDAIIVECKSVGQLEQIHRAQLFNYMRLAKKPCGVLVNFYPAFAEIERYLYDAEADKILTINGKVIV